MDIVASCEAELERQLQEVRQDRHPVYTREAFLSEGPKVGDQFATWKLKREQQRLFRALFPAQGHILVVIAPQGITRLGILCPRPLRP